MFTEFERKVEVQNPDDFDDFERRLCTQTHTLETF